MGPKISFPKPCKLDWPCLSIETGVTMQKIIIISRWNLRKSDKDEESLTILNKFRHMSMDNISGQNYEPWEFDSIKRKVGSTHTRWEKLVEQAFWQRRLCKPMSPLCLKPPQRPRCLVSSPASPVRCKSSENFSATYTPPVGAKDILCDTLFEWIHSTTHCNMKHSL